MVDRDRVLLHPYRALTVIEVPGPHLTRGIAGEERFGGPMHAHNHYCAIPSVVVQSARHQNSEQKPLKLH